MALFGGQRDVSFLRKINRELMGDIITQQASFYKVNIKETKTNIYGESSEKKAYIGPVLLNCLISREGQEFTENGSIIDFEWGVEFRFYRDDLVEANLIPEIGDIILFQERYYEVDKTNSNQYFVGKNPDYPNSLNPLNPGLEKFGQSVSIVCVTHYVDSNKLGIENSRL
jgi:hypothetical protein